MNRDQLREIVAEQVRRALRGELPAAEAEAGASRPSVVAVFCGGHAGLPTALQQTRLVAARARVTALLSRAAKETIGEQRLKSEAGVHQVVLSEGAVDPRELAHRADVIVVAQLTHNSLAKIALGLSDTPATNVVLHGLLAGKPVVVARDGVDPALAGCELCAGGADTARELLQLYDEYVGRLAAFGCRVVRAEQLSEATLEALTQGRPRREAPGASRRVITEDDVVRAARRGESIAVAGAIVTALARDSAQQLGVPLLEE